ncbi:B-cell receptor CD22-like isoform X1 [Lepisosteus oculatus]|uniref:B-cell receptor CD22-like n=2 Tax=Lepisosteus oculatus TaxID=7918 RepID=W5MCP6_LEPOC|nr:PREDICTED: sialoadhesin-like isoform X1 [Lepisosteus oculatus]
MGVEYSLSLWGMTLLILSGVYGSDWAVSYPRRTICTVRGSSVIIRCSYNYPKEFTVHSQSVQHKVTTVMWCKTNTTCNENISIYNSDNEPFRQKIVYLGNKQKNCTLMINDVEEIDNGRYKFRFQTNNPGGQWTGNPGVTLTVSATPWKVKANSTRKKDTFKEGDSVTLMCHTGSCFPTTTELTWFKNGQPISNRQTTANTLHFNSVSYEDYGNYSCASKANTSISSPQFSLDVKYSPKSTSVSVSPSGQILEGSSVTLTCRSNANPPVKNYIWFKMSSAGVQETGQGQNLTLAEVSSGDSGHYFCGAQNKHGAENSTAVVLAVAAKQNPAVLPVVLVVILLSISALVSYICLKRKRVDPSEEESNRNTDTEETKDHTYGNMVPSHNPKRTQEQSVNEEDDVNYSTVHFLSKTTPRNELPFEETEDASVLYSIVRT